MSTKQRQYIDFKLYLTAAPDGKGACQVALLPTPEVGETITPVTVPLKESPPPDALQLLAAKQGTFGSIVKLGQKLANSLLPEGVIRERFRAAYDRSGTDGGVRLRLIIADHALKAWPWEYAFFDFLGGQGSTSMLGFLALNPRISIVRHEPLPHPHPMREKTIEDVTDIHIAFASALPKNQPKLRLDEDLAGIQEVLKECNVEGVHFTLAPVLTDATPDDLVQKLPKGTHIFHFAGHGIPESDSSVAGSHREAALLLVADKRTKAETRLHASDLAAIIQAAGVRLVVLGACNSGERQERSPWEGVAAALAAREIPAIVAMQYEVIDVSAKAFSRALYGALASGLSLDEAMVTGRRAILSETSTNPDLKYTVDFEWGVPTLYSRLPDGQLFPERMQRAGQAAEEFRKVISQTITDTQKGVLAGFDVKIVKGGVKVVQVIKTAMGKVTGGKAHAVTDEAKIEVDQKIENAGENSNICGLEADEI